MIRSIGELVVSGFLIAVCAAHGQTSVQLEGFTERLSKDVPVSGRTLVGAVIVAKAQSAPPVSPRLLWRTSANEKPAEPLCVTLTSRDGVYYGEGQIGVGTLASLAGPVRVQGRHAPEAEKHLRMLPAEDLAMLAAVGDCRLGAREGLVVHVLDRRDGESPAPASAVVQLMLNSLTYTLAVQASVNGGPARPIACTTLDSAQRNRSFNTVCELPITALAGRAEIEISRRRYERVFAPVKVNLAWSAP